jgi:hypothetical protein
VSIPKKSRWIINIHEWICYILNISAGISVKYHNMSFERQISSRTWPCFFPLTSTFGGTCDSTPISLKQTVHLQAHAVRSRQAIYQLCGTTNFIIVYARVRQKILHITRWIQSILPQSVSLTYTIILFYHLLTGLLVKPLTLGIRDC